MYNRPHLRSHRSSVGNHINMHQEVSMLERIHIYDECQDSSHKNSIHADLLLIKCKPIRCYCQHATALKAKCLKQLSDKPKPEHASRSQISWFPHFWSRNLTNQREEGAEEGRAAIDGGGARRRSPRTAPSDASRASRRWSAGSCRVGTGWGHMRTANRGGGGRLVPVVPSSTEELLGGHLARPHPR
jgi:hypothetical protein